MPSLFSPGWLTEFAMSEGGTMCKVLAVRMFISAWRAGRGFLDFFWVWCATLGAIPQRQQDGNLAEGEQDGSLLLAAIDDHAGPLFQHQDTFRTKKRHRTPHNTTHSKNTPATATATTATTICNKHFCNSHRHSTFHRSRTANAAERGAGCERKCRTLGPSSCLL